MPSRNLLQTIHHIAETAGRDRVIKAYLRDISVAEAEDMLAQVWRRVEQYGTELPDVHFYFGEDGRIDIEFSFSKLALAALVLGGPFSPAFQSVGRKIRQTGHRVGDGPDQSHPGLTSPSPL